ncbi:MAG: NUDIX domain-containing protein [Bacteroidetes bacterium]|nr:MAG: NUDIX domain-containing protein [Bacteroidota bacterium]
MSLSPGLRQAPKFKKWVADLLEQGLKIHEIQEVFTRSKHDGDLLFAMLMLDATTPEGDKIPPVCFMKGQVVSIMVLLIDEATGERFLLLVKQRRICNGGLIYEQVAGMVDGDDDPHEVAVREVEEETGLKVTPEQVISLNAEPYWVSTGTSEEAMFFYYCALTLDRASIEALDGNQMGVISEHERIHTEVVPYAKARHLITNANGILNMFLYEEQQAG